MNWQMWANAATQRNVAELRAKEVAILATVAARPHVPYHLGFPVEREDAERKSEDKRRRKKLALRIANCAQDAFGSDQNEVALLDDAGAQRLPQMGKLALGRVVGEIGRRLRT